MDKLDPLNAPPSREAKAVWDEAKQSVARIRQLYEQRAIADVDLDAAEAAERVAEARYASALNGVREKMAAIQLQKSELEIAEQELSRTEIVAPIDGRIQSRNVASVISLLQDNLSLPSQSHARFDIDLLFLKSTHQTWLLGRL